MKFLVDNYINNQTVIYTIIYNYIIIHIWISLKVLKVASNLNKMGYTYVESLIKCYEVA